MGLPSTAYRVHLRFHTVLQVMVGAGLGTGWALVVFFVLYPVGDRVLGLLLRRGPWRWAEGALVQALAEGASWQPAHSPNNDKQD